MDQALKENKQSKQLDEKEKQILNNVRKTVVAKDKMFNDAVDEKRKENTVLENNLPSTKEILEVLEDNSTYSTSDESETEIDKTNITTNNSMCSSCDNTFDNEICTGINLGNDSLAPNAVANITDVFETDDPWLKNNLMKKNKKI
jgi:hypothetical protein